jgi:hypothetical protein
LRLKAWNAKDAKDAKETSEKPPVSFLSIAFAETLPRFALALEGAGFFTSPLFFASFAPLRSLRPIFFYQVFDPELLNAAA